MDVLEQYAFKVFKRILSILQAVRISRVNQCSGNNIKEKASFLWTMSKPPLPSPTPFFQRSANFYEYGLLFDQWELKF